MDSIRIFPRRLTVIVGRTGHIRRIDGSVIRLDFECDHYVGTFYAPDMQIKAQAMGSRAEVHSVMLSWTQVVGHVNGVLPERLQGHHVEGALVGGGQHHRVSSSA
jgi:hypothetical protein